MRFDFAVFLAIVLVPLSARSAAAQSVVKVDDTPSLREALQGARPGTRIELAPGEYAGGIMVSGLAGTRKEPVLVCAADRERPPVIRGGTAGLHLIDPAHVHLRDLVFEGASGNGLNVDDGGSYETPAHDVVLERIVVRDVGPGGNRDGIKLSGVDRFTVVDTSVERWGKGGSGIDMVGCHDGQIEGCTFVHDPGQGGSGVQAKGGTRAVTIRRCRFEHAGQRAVNLGGSTGLRYFRPEPAGYEAKELVVEGCTFIGSLAPVAFVGVDGAVVRFNTIYRPARWVVRVLQETADEEFVPCRDGRFTDNLVVLDADVAGRAVNVGPHTAPSTFTFARNAWFCPDAPDRSRPRLPVEERDGTYGEGPAFRDEDALDLRQTRESALRRFGADALR